MRDVVSVGLEREDAAIKECWVLGPKTDDRD